MKAYCIRDPEKLKQIVPMMRTQQERDRVAAFARVWSVNVRKKALKAETFARVEIGRSARVFRSIGGDMTVLGTANLAKAREFAEGLEVTA